MELKNLMMLNSKAISILTNQISQGIQAKVDYVQHKEIETEYNQILNEVSG